MMRFIRQALALSILMLGGCREAILHELDELAANRVKVVLASAGIPASKERDGSKWRIMVSKEDVTAALSQIESSRILKPDLLRTVERSGGLVESREERAFFIERQLSLNLETTLERLPNVLEARVHLTGYGGDKGRLRPQPPSSASVLLIAGHGEARISEQDIRRLVSGASGIPATGISVLISQANRAAQLPIQAAPQESTRPDVSTRTDLKTLAQLPAFRAALIASIVGITLLLLAVRSRKGKTVTPSPAPSAEARPVVNNVHRMQRVKAPREVF